MAISTRFYQIENWLRSFFNYSSDFFDQCPCSFLFIFDLFITMNSIYNFLPFWPLSVIFLNNVCADLLLFFIDHINVKIWFVLGSKSFNRSYRKTVLFNGIYYLWKISSICNFMTFKKFRHLSCKFWLCKYSLINKFIWCLSTGYAGTDRDPAGMMDRHWCDVMWYTMPSYQSLNIVC